MISVREEVRAKAQRCAEDAYNTAVAVQRGENVSESCTTIANQAADAIMSAFKRASGVVVKELEWELVDEDFEAEHYVAESPFGKIIAQQDESGWLVVLPYGDGGPWRLSTGFASQVQADLARRITSAVEPTETPDQLTQAGEGQPEATQAAVEPSCVVTDDMVLAGCRAVSPTLFQHGLEPLSSHGPATQAAIRREVRSMRLALTAALSSRTEEEPEHWEVGPPPSPEEAARCRQKALELDKRAARLLVEEEIRADERERLAKEFREHHQAQAHPDLTWAEVASYLDGNAVLGLRARSLTNGGE